ERERGLPPPQEAVGQLLLAALEREHALLDGAGGDELVDEDRAGLADPVSAVGGLSLGGGVPPGVVVDHGVGAGEVEAGTARLEADEEDLGPALLEGVDGALAVGGGARQLAV